MNQRNTPTRYITDQMSKNDWTEHVHYKWLEAKTLRPRLKPVVIEDKA